MSYKSKKKLLLALILILILFIFYRGFALHLVKSFTERTRYHAIPTALSVLYHNHPHDYTGLREVALNFQNNGKISDLISHAIKQKITNNDKYYWVADDKGFLDYVIASFYLFGPQPISMYLFWFILLGISTGLYVTSFYKKNWALGYLCLVLLGINLTISALPLASVTLGYNHISVGVAIYETRVLDILAFIAVIHMMLLASSNRTLQWKRDKLPIIGQLILFLFLYHCRSSLGWQLVAIVVFSLTFLGIRFYQRKTNNINNKNYYRSKNNVLFIFAILMVGIICLNVYKHISYNKKYFGEMGHRTFWHNALMGLSYDNKIAKQYGLSVDDYLIADSVIHYAKNSNTCDQNISRLSARELLNTLGGYGVANWKSYEKCARSYYASIIKANKIKTLKMYAIKKPFNILYTVWHATNPNSTLPTNIIINKLGIGWYPFSITNICFYLTFLMFSFTALSRVGRKLLLLITIVCLCSFIPSVAFYHNIYSGLLTTSGVFVSISILLYLLLYIVLRMVIERSKNAKHVGLISNYPLMKKELSIIIPAYNEENKIAQTIQEVFETAKKVLEDFEIFVINDGSADATYNIAYATANELGAKIKIINREKNAGVGAAFQFGLEHAKFPQLTLIPGDNAFCKSGIETLFRQCGLFPLVISYRKNMTERTPLRHFLSKLATFFLQLISGKKIQDAHSLYLFPVEATKQLNIQASGYGYHIEILSRLLTRIRLFNEVPVLLNPKPDASSGVMTVKTLLILGFTIAKLFVFKLIKKL